MSKSYTFKKTKYYRVAWVKFCKRKYTIFSKKVLDEETNLSYKVRIISIDRYCEKEQHGILETYLYEFLLKNVGKEWIQISIKLKDKIPSYLYSKSLASLIWNNYDAYCKEFKFYPFIIDNGLLTINKYCTDFNPENNKLQDYDKVDYFI